jgi:Flp pilus assembly pilin Flp
MRLPAGIWVLIAVTVVIAGLAMYGYLTGAWERPLPP